MDYRLQIAPESGFSEPLTADINVGNNFYCDLNGKINGLTAGVSYYWRVVDSDGVTSPIATFQPGLTTSPFRLEVSSDNFASTVVDASVGSAVEYDTTTFNRDTTYQWRVSGKGAIASEARAFTTKPPIAAPVTGAVEIVDGRAIHIAWAPISGAYSYRVAYRMQNGGEYNGTGLFLRPSAGELPSGTASSFDVNVSALSNPAYPTVELVGGDVGTSYWFSITALDEESSPMLELAEPVVMRDIIPATNLSVESLNGTMSVSWDPSSDAIGYRVYYKTHSGGVYDGTGLKLSLESEVLGSYVDVMVDDLADPAHPHVNFYGGTFGTSYWFGVSALDAGMFASAKVEASLGFQLMLMPPTAVNAVCQDGMFTVSWVRDTRDALSTGFYLYYKTDPASPIYNGTGLKVGSIEGTAQSSPITIDGTGVVEAVLYGGVTDVPYWFGVATKDAGGNTSGIVVAPHNVTVAGAALDPALAVSPGLGDISINQTTKQITLNWNIPL